MLKNRLIYLALLLALVLFFVLYKDILAAVLLAAAVILPLISAISAFFARLNMNFSAEIKSGAVQTGDNVPIYLNLRRSIFPVGKVRFDIACKNVTLGCETLSRSYIGILHKKDTQFLYNITSEHIGLLEISALRAVIYDCFGLIGLPIKLSCTASVSVLPEILPCFMQIRNNIYTIGQSEVFSRTKRGDDPSEIFDIRDYANGDKLNRIHWKLSIKQDKYLVKDYSYPLNESILLYADMTAPCGSFDKTDMQFSALLSLAYELYRQQIPFFIGWYDEPHDRYMSEKIETQSDIYSCIGEIYNAKICENAAGIEQSDLIQNNFSHIALFCAGEKQKCVGSLRPFDEKNILCSVFAADNEAGKTVSGGIIIYSLGADGAELSDILL